MRRTSIFRRRALLGGLAFTLGWAAASAFAVDTGMRALRGHVPPATAQIAPKGTLPPASVLNLAIGLPVRNAQGFADLLARVYDPASVDYRHYLTPAEFTERFGPSEADYAALIHFAETNGLAVTATHGNRLLLDVSGPVANIQRAFHITLRTYRHPTEARDFYAPDTEPSAPRSLAVADISGLDNYTLPRPRVVTRDGASPPSGAPRVGTGSAPGGSYLGKDFRAAYLPDVTLTGAGQIVGLFELDGFYQSDITAYESAAGLPAVPIQTVLLDGYDGTPSSAGSSGNTEVSLDIEMALAMAPGLAKIIVFEAGSSGLQNDVLNAMAASNQVRQFSCSWGWPSGPDTTTDTIFKLMALQGQSFFNASGDSDAFTVGANSANGVDNPNLQNAPSSCPYITMVGGTTLTTTGPKGAWSSEKVWNWGLQKHSYVGSSGGVSSAYLIPSWQTGVSMAANGGSTTYRNIPDVALTADNVYVLEGNGGSTSVGGTSCAAPLWAGLAALINQQATASGWGPIGFVNPAIYAIGRSNIYSSTFHDITTGNNYSSASPNAYAATAGYDLCTGWGTPAGQALINALAGSADSLVASPTAGFAATGPVGGPFNVTPQTILLTNTSSSPLTWSLINTSAWLNASVTAGTLAARGTGTVVFSVASGATNLIAGAYSTVAVFTNLTSHRVQGGQFKLAVVAPNLLQNGGFETGDFTDWTLVGNTVVNDPVNGPTIYNAVESAVSGYPLVVHSGAYGAFMGDVQLATLSQTVATVPGQNYVLSLWLDNPSSSGTQQFVVRWNTNSPAVNTIYNLLSPPVLTWTNLLFIVQATGTSTVLQIGAENDNNYFGIDDVSLLPLPALNFETPVIAGDNVTLTWLTAVGIVYQVQYTTDLAQPNWLNLASPATATGGFLTVTDSNALLSSQQRFYRLVAAP